MHSESYAAVMASRITFTDDERAYVRSQPLGRLATVDANGAPQNNPVGVYLDEETGDSHVRQQMMPDRCAGRPRIVRYGVS